MISCANHDYVEIACLYHLEVKLVLKNGQIIQGKASQTAYNENREECIVLETGSGNETVVLDGLDFMVAVTKNPHFDRVELS